MADKPTSAEQYLAKATAANAKARDTAKQNQRIETFTAHKAAGLKVPDLNPADRAVMRMREHAQHIKDYQALPPTSNNADLRDRVARLENILQLTLDSLNAATITCSGSSIVLTFPDLPT